MFEKLQKTQDASTMVRIRLARVYIEKQRKSSTLEKFTFLKIILVTLFNIMKL